MGTKTDGWKQVLGGYGIYNCGGGVHGLDNGEHGVFSGGNGNSGG